MMKRFRGSCLCGQIRFSVTGFRQQVANCHCTMCRKFHGAAFGTLVETQDLQWDAGEHQLAWYTADNGTQRAFCPNCGSSLGFLSAGALPSALEIAIACFDEPIPVTVDAQIFTDNKANWCALDANIPTYGQARQGK